MDLTNFKGTVNVGKCSEFGGPNDATMANDTGLAFYEPWEANKRPDMFHAEQSPNEATWKRLKTEFFYLALRLDNSVPRVIVQNTPFKIKNLATGAWCIGFPVDRGPGIEDRLADLSPGIMAFLNLKTDDLVEVTRLAT